jgi:ABC-2 type transport system permease protein
MKERMIRNGMRGQPWRVVAFVLALLIGLWLSLLAFVGLLATAVLHEALAFSVAVIAGSAVVLGWALIPLLFFGVDETLDPARFALLPLRRTTLLRGMLAAAFVGVPAVATLLATSGLVVAMGLRSGLVPALAALIGVLAGLVLGIVASRAVTSACAAMLRRRRVRDLAIMAIALLAASVSPLQLWLTSWASTGHGHLRSFTSAAEWLAWTPLGAPYALPFDAALGRWDLVAIRFATVAVAIALLLWWWSTTLESAMFGGSGDGPARTTGHVSVGPVRGLFPPLLRPLLRPSRFAAIVARESRFWWRDPRRRASLVLILVASIVVPMALNVAETAGHGQMAAATAAAVPLTFTVTMAGSLGGMLLANQFAFDGNAYAAHLLASVPGRVELRARAIAVALVALPVLSVGVVLVTVVSATETQLPADLGTMVAAFGAAVAAAGYLSVLAPYSLPDTSNPFALNNSGGSVKGLFVFAALLGTLILSAPMTIAANLLTSVPGERWLVLVLGLAYGVAVVGVGTAMAGDVLDRRGPQVLLAVTPRR